MLPKAGNTGKLFPMETGSDGTKKVRQGVDFNEIPFTLRFLQFLTNQTTCREDTSPLTQRVALPVGSAGHSFIHLCLLGGICIDSKVVQPTPILQCMESKGMY